MKNYHKGVRIQLYISEELNEKLEDTINLIKENNTMNRYKNISRSEFIRNCISSECDDLKEAFSLKKDYGV